MSKTVRRPVPAYKQARQPRHEPRPPKSCADHTEQRQMLLEYEHFDDYDHSCWPVNYVN